MRSRGVPWTLGTSNGIEAAGARSAVCVFPIGRALWHEAARESFGGTKREGCYACPTECTWGTFSHRGQDNGVSSSRFAFENRLKSPGRQQADLRPIANGRIGCARAGSRGPSPAMMDNATRAKRHSIPHSGPRRLQRRPLRLLGPAGGSAGPSLCSAPLLPGPGIVTTVCGPNGARVTHGVRASQGVGCAKGRVEPGSPEARLPRRSVWAV